MNERVLHWLKESPLVITGMGAVSSAGNSSESLWNAVLAGKSLAHPIGYPGYPYAGCSVPQGMVPLERNPLLKKADRSAHLAVAAAREAWRQSAPPAGEMGMAAERVAVFAGTSRGPVNKMLESVEREKMGRVLPSSAASSTIASLSGLVALGLGAGGPALTVSAACASAAAAIGLAAEQVLLGNVDIAVAGGAEAPLHPVVLSQLHAAGVLGAAEHAAEICRPFDLRRNGTVLGEGAAFLVIETAENARKRGSRALARLSGWAVGTESGERTGISDDSAALVRVMQDALTVAGLKPEDIGYINAHGTGTVLNDRQETVACRRVFGEQVPPCSSIKPVIGHCMGAAAALEAVVCLGTLRHGLLPPTPNWEQPDPECAMDIIRGEARRANPRHVMSNSSGFWGNNATLIFSGL